MSGTRKGMNRRDFLRLAAGGAALSLLSACGATPTATPVPPTATKPPAPPTAAPAAPTATKAPAPAATTAPAPAPTAAPPAPTAAPTQAPSMFANKFSNVTLKIIASDLAYTAALETMFGDFTKLTGAKINYEKVTFPVANTQEELELSSGSSTYDVMMIIFIKAQKWIQAGWIAPLDPFIQNKQLTDDKLLALDDFLPAAIDPFRFKNQLFGLSYIAETTQLIYRKDVLDAAGFTKAPDTLEEMGQIAAKVNKKGELAGYIGRVTPTEAHFTWPIFVQGYGGNLFRDPPNDMTPTINSAESVKATELFTSLMMKYGPAGISNFATTECQNAMSQGQAAIWLDALGIMGPIIDKTKSKVADKVAFAIAPKGPAGRFPQIASHGWMIPKNAKNKEASWAFIQWALSRDVILQTALKGEHAGVPRGSVLANADYKKKYFWAGTDVGGLVTEALKLAKIAYRVVPEFPQVGERCGQAIGQIVSGQMGVKPALDAAQADVVTLMQKAGYTIKP